MIYQSTPWIDSVDFAIAVTCVTYMHFAKPLGNFHEEFFSNSFDPCSDTRACGN